MIGSDIIRWVLKRDFSHTWLKFKMKDLYSNTVFHAVGNGLSYISEPAFLQHNEVIEEFELEISDSLYNHILNLCHSYASVKYGYWQNLGIGFVKFLKLFGINYRRNPFNEGLNCSEWCALVLTEVYGKWTDKESNLIDPTDVYNYLKDKQK